MIFLRDFSEQSLECVKFGSRIPTNGKLCRFESRSSLIQADFEMVIGRRQFVRSFRFLSPRSFGDANDNKIIKSRYKRFARSYRSMNPRNFFDM